MKIRVALVIIAACTMSVSHGEQVTFTVDSDLSVIQLTDQAFIPSGDTVALPPQQGDGDTVAYTGTITGDLVGSTLTFDPLGGSSVIALEHPKASLFIPEEGGPGGFDDPAAQDLNYAYEAPGFPVATGGTDTLYVQLFDTVLDFFDGSITDGQTADGFDVSLKEGGYGLALPVDITNDNPMFAKPYDIINIDDPFETNATSDPASIALSDNVQTLTIPIETAIFFEIDASGGVIAPTIFELQGTIVGKRSLLGPSDINIDGSVDAADAGLMFSNWGSDGVGDLNNDGIVDAADAGTLFSDWTGDSVPEHIIPEPMTAGVFLAGGVALLCGLRRKR